MTGSILPRLCLTHLLLAVLILVYPPQLAVAEQPFEYSKSYKDSYSEMITTYTSDDDIEVLPKGELGLPATMIILNERSLDNQKCDTRDSKSCERTVRVRYPRDDDREEDLDIDGQCQVIDEEIDPFKGICKYDKKVNYTQDFLGADSSATDPENLVVPGWQSYNHMYTNPQCGTPNSNNLTYGSHDNLLNTTTQAKLKLSVLWRAYSTFSNFNGEEMPIGGVNWLEKVQVGTETLTLLSIYQKLQSVGMGAPTYRHIWEKDEKPSKELLAALDESNIPSLFEDTTASSLLSVPPHIARSTWFARWNYLYTQARASKADWVKYFECTPLYPKDTDEPTIMIGSLVVGLAQLDIPFNFAFHDSSLVKNFASRQGTEGTIVNTVLMYPDGQGQKIVDEATKKVPLVAGYFDLSRTEPMFTPSALVGTDPSGGKVPTYKPLTTFKFGHVLDYPTQWFNPILRPPPRKIEYSREDLSYQDAEAVHEEAGSTIVETIEMIVKKIIPYKTRAYSIPGPYNLLSKHLVEPNIAVFANHQEVTTTTRARLRENNINVIPAADGTLFPTSNRDTEFIKDSFSRFMACKSIYRFDYENTPRMLADGTAINSCGEESDEEQVNSCSLDIEDSEAVESAVEQAAAKASKATGIPANWLVAISKVEGGTTQLGDQCVPNPASGALGPMQMKDGEYEDVTCEEERVGATNTSCERGEGKLSRCNLDDSMLLAARLLMFKLGEFPASCGSPAVSNISIERLYRAVNNYYSNKCEPDDLTSSWNVPGVTRTPNYADIVCNLAGQSSTCNSLPQCP